MFEVFFLGCVRYLYKIQKVRYQFFEGSGRSVVRSELFVFL